jgi:thymidylate synthase (FAD)
MRSSDRRPQSPDLDAILGQRLSVLDDGFVRVVDYMGCDDSIVQAARVSYGEGTKRVREDRTLIRYLLRHRHTTPFEMCEIKLHIRVPMDAWRQWIRHRTASVNEYSTRYSIAIDAAQRTAASAWRAQSRTNKQGSGEYLPDDVGMQLTSEEAEFQDQARDLYQRRLNAGVAREQARKDLPLSTYTEAYWKTDLHNLLHFLALRMDAHAQQEIRSYANLIGTEIVRRWVPVAWEAFEDYRLRSTTLSALEVRVLGAHLTGGPAASRDAARALGWLEPDEHGRGWRRNRERDEFVRKIAGTLGAVIDWPYDGNKQ